MTFEGMARMTAGKLVAVLVFAATSFVSCSGAYFASQAVFFPRQTDFSRGTPPDFAVVVEDREAKDPHDRFTVAPLRRVPELLKRNPDILRLSRKQYSAEVGDPWRFKVLEETAQFQVVELEHRNTSGIKVRYRVEGDRVTPLYYNTDGGIILMTFLLPVFLLCLVLGVWAARRAARWMSRGAETARE